jgi:asparagine synthase (glutamine-hydrolysing)
MKGVKRGPEFSKLDSNFNKIKLGFHRLAINGLNEESNQPLLINNIALICNGEIYNYKRLYSYMDIQPTTGSDCEVIIHLYLKYGIEQTLSTVGTHPSLRTPQPMLISVQATQMEVVMFIH